MKTTRIAPAVFIAIAALAGCRADESLHPLANLNDKMFLRYVSMGNSITAGFQSAGINDSTQQRGYAVLLSKAMGTAFIYPSLQGRGCPPPFTNNVSQARVGGGTSTSCDLRATPTGPINDVAVPGAHATSLLFNDSVTSNALTTFILGGRTQVESMKSRHPTFVSVWIGNNDILGSLTSLANPGDPALVTPVATFTVKYDSVLDAIQSTGANAVLVTVGDVTVIPYASAAAIYYCLKNGGCPAPLPPQDPTFAAIPTFTVNVNCAPPGGLSILVPWPVGLTKLSTAVAGQPATIDCSVDNEVVTTAELGNLIATVQAYNQHIQSEATSRGFAFFDVNPPLAALVANGTIPSFPDVAPALAGSSVGFGPIFSLDGVHPSSTAHRLLADSIASAINQKYNTTLPVDVCAAVTCPAP